MINLADHDITSRTNINIIISFNQTLTKIHWNTATNGINCLKFYPCSRTLLTQFDNTIQYVSRTTPYRKVDNNFMLCFWSCPLSALLALFYRR